MISCKISGQFVKSAKNAFIFCINQKHCWAERRNFAEVGTKIASYFSRANDAPISGSEYFIHIMRRKRNEEFQEIPGNVPVSGYADFSADQLRRRKLHQRHQQ
jgi:hypothetical protein